MNFKKSFSDICYISLNYTFLSLLGIVTLFPFLYMFMISLIAPADYLKYGVTFPKNITLENYITFLGPGSKLLPSYQVTIIVTVVGTALALFLTSTLAYALSRKYLPGRRSLNAFLVFTMLFSAGIIPRYFVVKYLGMIDTLWAIMVPQAIIVWYVFLMRSFFSGIPDSLEESAKIDGANDFTVMFRIYFPLSLPVIATISLFYAVGRWNEWFDALMFISNPDKQPLQLLLRNIISFSQQAMDPKGSQSTRITPPSDIMKMTSIMVAVLPILCVYPFVQKYFVKGALMGSIKG